MAAFTFTSSGGASAGGDLTTIFSAYGFISSGGVASGGDQTAIHSAYGFRTSGGPAVGLAPQIVQGTSNGATVIATGRAPAFTTK